MAIFRKNSSEIQRIPDGCQERILRFAAGTQWEWLHKEADMAGVSKLVPGYHITRFNTQYGVCIFVLEGKVYVKCQNVSQEVIKGEFFYLPPAGDRHEYWAEDESSILWFHLNVMDAFWSGIPVMEAYVQSYSNVNTLLQLFEYIWEEHASPEQESLLLRDLSSALMLYLRRKILTGRKRHRNRSVLQRVFRQASRNLQKRWSVSELAKNAAMSVSSFNMAVRECYGKSPAGMLLEMRLTVAARLISCDGFTLDMAAAQTGFDSGFSLSRAFKRKTGMSPREWRNSGTSLVFATS